MLPEVRSCMPGSTAWVTASTPRRFTAIRRSHWSSVDADEEVVVGDAGVVHQHVDRAELGLDRRDRGAAPTRVERTSSSTPRPSMLGGELARPVEVEVGDGHARALGGQPRAGGGADAAGAARDQRDPSLEPHGREQAIASRAPWKPIPIIGGTGALGFGLALRLAAAGRPVVIGSRDAGRAEEAAAKVREQVPGARSRASRTPAAATRGPIVFLTVPVPRAVGEPDQPQGGARARARSWWTPPCRWPPPCRARPRACSGVPQGSAAAAGAGDGARRRDRGERAAHGERRRARRPRRSSSTRTCWCAATTGRQARAWPS